MMASSWKKSSLSRALAFAVLLNFSGASSRRQQSRQIGRFEEKIQRQPPAWLSPSTMEYPRGGGSTADEKRAVTVLPSNLAIAFGLVLAFNSGYMNGFCLSGFFLDAKQPAAAMTGAYTNSALALAARELPGFFLQMRTLGGYILGATVAGALNPRPIPFVLGAGVGPTFLLASAAVVLACTVFQDTKWCLFLAAIANGIQNSLTSAHSANLLRTTHYTGISSDMGTFLGQLLRGNLENLYKLKVFFALGICFWTGGYLSFHIGKKSGLWASARLYGILGTILIYQAVCRQLERRKVEVD